MKNNHQTRELDEDNNFSRTIQRYYKDEYETVSMKEEPMGGRDPEQLTNDNVRRRRRRSIVPRRSSCGAT